MVGRTKMYYIRGLSTFVCDPHVIPCDFVFCKRCLIGLKSIDVVYKLLLFLIPKQCGTYQKIDLHLMLMERVVDLNPQ
jgi:hypothetical protein